MRAWDFYHQIEKQQGGPDKWYIPARDELIEFMMPRALNEFDDQDINDFIEGYPIPNITEPVIGDWIATIFIKPSPNPVMSIEKKNIVSKSMIGKGNIDLTKNRFVSAIYFNTENEINAFLVAIKTRFMIDYQINQQGW